MDDNEPIIEVTASSLAALIRNNTDLRHALKECDGVWNNEYEKWRALRGKMDEQYHTLRNNVADALGLPVPPTVDDEHLLAQLRQALAVTTLTIPRGTFVIDHDSARHALDDGLLDKMTAVLRESGLDAHKHEPGDAPPFVTFSIDDAVGATQTPWRAGDIIRYSDDQGPIVDGELVMRERDEDDTTWVAKIVYVHQETTPYSGAEDGEKPYVWEVGENVYPIEGDERFTKILAIEDKPWAVDDLIEHRGSHGLIFRARVTAADPHERGDNWWSAVVTELVRDPFDVAGPAVGQTLLLRQQQGGPNVRVGGLETPSPAADLNPDRVLDAMAPSLARPAPVGPLVIEDPRAEIKDPTMDEQAAEIKDPTPAEVLNPFTRLDRQPTALNGPAAEQAADND